MKDVFRGKRGHAQNSCVSLRWNRKNSRSKLMFSMLWLLATLNILSVAVIKRMNKWKQTNLIQLNLFGHLHQWKIHPSCVYIRFSVCSVLCQRLFQLCWKETFQYPFFFPDNYSNTWTLSISRYRVLIRYQWFILVIFCAIDALEVEYNIC